MVRFSASQSVTISVPTQPLSIKDYLSNPERLVFALADPQQVERLGPDLFQLKVRAVKFLSFVIQPVCEIEIWLEEDVVRLRSERCQVEGYEALNQKFSMSMQGYLVSHTTAKGVTTLRGQANLIVTVDLPQAMKFTPKPLLERAGNGLLNGILITLKQRLMRQLIADYCTWASTPSSTSRFSFE